MSDKVIQLKADTFDTIFYDKNGKEYFRIGPDKVPEDVYFRFADWVRSSLPNMFPEGLESLQTRVSELEELNEKLKLEAQSWKGEDNGHKSSLFECYQAVGAQKGDWNGAQPVIDYVKALQEQLPEGMKDCTILFKSCEVGHGRLTAKNWIQHECQTCEIKALQEQLEELTKRQVGWAANYRNQKDENIALQEQLAEAQEQLKDNLQWVRSGVAHNYGGDPLKNPIYLKAKAATEGITPPIGKEGEQS